MAYRDFQSVPLTSGDSIESGAVGLKHFDAPTFQAIQQIKLHKHTGVDSQQLDPIAVPNNLKALGPLTREEHGTTGGAGSVGFALPFLTAPTVIVGALSASAVYATSVSATGFTMNGGAGSWLAIGR